MRIGVQKHPPHSDISLICQVFDDRYSIDGIYFQPVVSMQFLGDEETVKKAIESVANQGKAK